LEKYSLFSGSRSDGNPNIHLVEPGSRYGMDKTAGLEMTKTGEHLSGVQELIESIEPQSDRLYLLNSSLGAGEYVGFNLRGDWFSEEGLLHTPKGWDDIPVWDIDTRRQRANDTEKVGNWGNLAWGFPTFYNAHRFRHHVNKDPNRAYGFVLGAFWDERMHRIILVTELIRSMCERLGSSDVYDRIARGEFPDTSMGAKVPYDVCAICGNIARSPKNYCEHVRKGASSPYGMRSILPDGRMCGVKNTHPRFFDDSLVFIGAEKSAKMMSNLTDQVQGDRPYSQKVYAFGAPMNKAASAPSDADQIGKSHGSGGSISQGVPNAREEAESNLSEAAKNVFKAPPPDDTLEQKLSRMLDGVPLSGPKERELLRHLQDREKAHSRLSSRDLSEQEYNQWKAVELTRLRKMGVTNSDIQNLKKGFEDAAKDQISEKSASTKWADILKTIPLPSEDHLATIRVHERGLPDLDRDQLDQLAEDPGNRLRAAARLGVVLRPHEFQYAMLKGDHPKEAMQLMDDGKVFSPCPVGTELETGFDPRTSVPSEALEAVREILDPLLSDRSFAPRAVRTRITNLKPVATAEPFLEEESSPLLDKVASLYNLYRAGLLAHAPDWRYVDIDSTSHADLGEEEKLASSSIELSKELLNLAYWPALPVG
jgi:hypothetical protein